MDDVILLRAGNREGMPALADRELVYARDEDALYIGTPEGNRKVGEAALNAKLTATPAASQAALNAAATLPEMVAAYNSLVAALKAAGIMSK